ncbi:MAG: peptide deformylase [Parcubacteria group bacterium]|jgi:peptide deformylase
MPTRAKLKIIKFPDDFLRRKTRKVEEFKDANLQSLVFDMLKTMEIEKGIGLAAPQVGSDLRICVIKVDNTPYILINPEIKSFSRKKEISEEGCLSFPGKYFPVERPVKVKIKARDLKGKKMKIKADGLLARVLQHEIDHLDGVLIIDRTMKNF